MLTESFTNNKIDTIYKLKHILHKYIYSDQNIIASYLDALQQSIDPFNINIDSDLNIYIKIKKSNMRKLDGFYHDPSYYYSLVSSIFSQLIINNIDTILVNYNNEFNESVTLTEVLSYSIFLLDIKTLLDNTIIIKL